MNLNCESPGRTHIKRVSLHGPHWKQIKLLFYLHFCVEIRFSLGTRAGLPGITRKSSLKTWPLLRAGAQGVMVPWDPPPEGGGRRGFIFSNLGDFSFFVTGPYCFNVQCFRFETLHGNTVQLQCLRAQGSQMVPCPRCLPLGPAVPRSSLLSWRQCLCTAYCLLLDYNRGLSLFRLSPPSD